MVAVQGELAIANSAVTTAVVLDANGMPMRELPLPQRDGKRILSLPGDALYVMLVP